jgi:hypothetical protein
MSVPVKSQQDLYDLFIATLQSNAPQLTDTLDGSTIDALAGVFSIAGTELSRYTINQFNKTFIDLANGPEVTGGPDDLQTLVVDHFGPAFARPAAVAAIDVATFSRASNAAGAITILAGTIVKTQPDANGNVQRYSTNSTVVLTASSIPSDLTISVPITAVVAGAAGDATVGTINVIESTLLDPTITTSNAGNATGEDAQDDATYRETIRNLIVALRAATRLAIQSAALSVPGVVVATAIEVETPVVFWNPATNEPLNAAVMGIFEYFIIPFVTLYIADATGSANSSLIAAVKAAINPIRAFGVNINIQGATAITINWSALLTLNPSGPNFSLFSSDTTEITDSMASYVSNLGAGVSFVRATARTAILAIWGPGGTNDLTDFQTTVPSGDVTIASNQTAIPGTIETV